MRRFPWLEAVVLVACIAVLAAVETVQRPPDEAGSDTFSTYDAAPRGYRAVYDLLRAEGVDARRWERQDAFLDSSVGTLVYAPPDRAAILPFEAGRGSAAQIDAWVRAGGHLVLLEDPGFQLTKAVGFPYTFERGSRQRASHFDATLRDAGVLDVGSIGAPTRWLHRKRTHVLYDDGFGPVIVAYARGAGSVVGIVDPDMFTDATLASADRARLALALLAPAARGGAVWFDETLHGHEVLAHWWEVVPVPFRIAAAIALVAFLIALGGAAIRLGPPLVPPKRDDRTSADFIDALATLFARGRARGPTAQAAMHSATLALERALAISPETPEAQVASRITDDRRRDEYREMRALGERSVLDAGAFVRAVALAQTLRKDPTAHAR